MTTDEQIVSPRKDMIVPSGECITAQALRWGHHLISPRNDPSDMKRPDSEIVKSWTGQGLAGGYITTRTREYQLAPILY